MPLTTIDFSQDLATWLAGDGANLDTDITSGTVSPNPPTWANLARSLLQALYPAGRGAALSLKGRGSNTAGAVADIAAGTDGHVMRRSGTALAFGTLASGAFATAPGIVTPAMLDNGSARSVLGVTGNSGAARADIAGGGANTILKDTGTAVAFSTLTLADVAPGSVLYEVNFSALADNTFANGTEVIDGLSWTAANVASLGVFDIDNGAGMRLNAGTSLGAATAFSSTSQTAPHVYLPLSSLPNMDARHGRLIIEIYLSNIVHEASGEGVFVALWTTASTPHSTSTARVRLAGLYNGGTNRNARSTVQTTITTPDANLAGHDVLCLTIDDTGTGTVSTGTWSAGWPTALTQQVTLPTASGAADPILHASSRLVLGCSVANDASPTTAFTIERMRVRRG